MDITQATDGLVSIIKAFDIEVEDAMDGIISKVNEVGNKFAVSNGDVVEALTRSSSAMAAANNTFDETVALATAAIEITRDAASVGNGLKTLSMRIRGYDEETEEYSEGVAELTGAIADLTKTAKTPGGISLFEKDDPICWRLCLASGKLRLVLLFCQTLIKLVMLSPRWKIVPAVLTGRCPRLWTPWNTS